MAGTIELKQIRHGWNAFTSAEQSNNQVPYGTPTSYGIPPTRSRPYTTTERSIIASIYTRLSIDIASINFRHVRLDDNNRYLEDIDSGLNYCLNQEANIDQTPFAFMLDLAYTLFDRGVIAAVPVNTTLNPNVTGGFDIQDIRVGEIVNWYPRKVRVKLYNERTGEREEVVVDKSYVAIVENPFYSIMNEPNSTLQRLIRKLNLLDSVDEVSSSGRLDVIIQLPYAIKSESRREQAEQRRKDIEFQLRGSQYGIAYADATEKITQLNRPAENNLMSQVEYLTELLYNQLGLTKEIMSGTADEKAMRNYVNRTIEPILKAITQSFRRSFLTKTARTQKQSIQIFSNPFSLVPIVDMAEIADKFTRNEILTSNEIRQLIGIPPASDPKADELRNSNMPDPNPEVPEEAVPDEVDQEDEAIHSELDSIEAELDDALAEFGGI